MPVDEDPVSDGPSHASALIASKMKSVAFVSFIHHCGGFMILNQVKDAASAILERSDAPVVNHVGVACN